MKIYKAFPAETYLYFCSELSSLTSKLFAEFNDGTRCGESSSEGSHNVSLNGSMLSNVQLSLLPFFWKRSENVFLNFCNTLSVVELPATK